MEAPTYSINEWFNDSHLRIIGTVDHPFIYATDLGTALGIIKVGSSLSKFDEYEIVSPEVRAQHNLVTYRKYGDTMRVDNTVILLTMQGAYRLIFTCRSPRAAEIKRHLVDVIEAKRRAEAVQLRMIQQNDHDAALATIAEQSQQIAKWRPHVDEAKVFRKVINGNPYKHMIDREVDDYLASYCPEDTAEVLLKITTRPHHEDHHNYDAWGTVCGPRGGLLTSLEDAFIPLGTTEHAAKYCLYVAGTAAEMDDLTVRLGIELIRK